MKRLIPLLTVLAFAACGGPSELTPDVVMDLVPSAAAVPQSVLDEITRAGAAASPETVSTMPLSMLVMSVVFEDSDDLRRIPAGPATPSGLGDMWVKEAGRTVTMFPEECLSGVSVDAEGDRATGSFRFRREGLLEGKVEFEAERTDGDWRIVMFRLPGAKAETRLGAGGTWKAADVE